MGMGVHIVNKEETPGKKQENTFPNPFVWTEHGSCGRGLKTIPQPGTLILSPLLTFPRELQIGG